MAKVIGVLTAGGDCPGLNAVIRKANLDPNQALASQTWVVILVLSILVGIILMGFFIIFVYNLKTLQLYRLQHNFINSFTHELKTPVTALKLYLETFMKHELSFKSPSEIKEAQARLLSTQMRWVMENSPFYREHLDGFDVASIESLDDLRSFPLTTKQDLRDNYPFNMFAVPMDNVVRIHASSGTTGQPKGVVLSFDNVIRTAQNSIAFDKMTAEEEMLAYLPMAWVGDHIFSFAQSYCAGFCVSCPESSATVLQDLREAIEYCESIKDYVSRDLFDQILDSEEEHVDWLETQLGLIDKVGIENYLQAKMN